MTITILVKCEKLCQQNPSTVKSVPQNEKNYSCPRPCMCFATKSYKTDSLCLILKLTLFRPPPGLPINIFSSEGMFFGGCLPPPPPLMQNPWPDADPSRKFAKPRRDYQMEARRKRARIDRIRTWTSWRKMAIIHLGTSASWLILLSYYIKWAPQHVWFNVRVFRTLVDIQSRCDGS